MTKQQEVHLQLMSSLPVRTHYQPEPRYQQGGNPHFMTPVKCSERKKRIKELHKEGKKTQEIADILGVSKQTIYNHLRIR